MKEFESLSDLKKYIKGKKNISKIAIQSLDFTRVEKQLLKVKFSKCLFLGCCISDDLWHHLYDDNYIFPKLKVPYNAYPSSLYSKEILYNNYDYQRPNSYEKTLDKVVYNHFIKTGKEAKNIQETLARSLHDHSISDSLYEFLDNYEEKKVVAFMGGHGLSRDSESYRQITEISKQLTEEGYLMISGGGPGAMEATHVGAWFAGRANKYLDKALKILYEAPKYDHPNWLPTAFQVLEKYPKTKFKSLGIPTWLYGHEPPTPFATHIAKYFANSIREEGLLAVAKGGIIFAPGSAGTMQEIFQEIAQNHYESFGYASPMVFLNKEYWSYDRPVYPAIELMSLRGNLQNLDIGIYDSKEEVMAHIRRFTKIV